MPLLETCNELFGSSDLYTVLGVEKTASQGQIKKAYHKGSLKVHPDRVAEDEREICTKKFQCLSAVYTVLSDESRRGLYDETGEVEDESDPLSDPNKDWVDYWRNLFPKVTLKDLERFETEYRESAEEKEDLKKAYLEAEGNMDQILDTVMCAKVEDEARFRLILDKMIKEKEVEKFAAYKKDKKKEEKRKRAAEAEAEEAEELARELGVGNNGNNGNANGGEDGLRAMILARQANRGAQAENFLDSLAAKYAKPKKGKKK